jgi:hypothetical protein
MNERQSQFWELYRVHRFDDQYGWYKDRIDEYRRAHDQTITLTAVALFGAAAAGLAASADLAGWRVGWAVLAAVMSGIATLVGAYDQLIGYEQNIKVYRDAKAALGGLRATAPWNTTPERSDEPAAFVQAVETIFQNEIGQWGQLTAANPQPKTRTVPHHSQPPA